jgi:5-(carboxyamino)imidazole ribonucleotide mutase
LTEPHPLVGVVMGSASDWQTLQHAATILAEFGIAHECRVVSAHRMPDDLFAYAEQLPVLGVPVASKHLNGVDSLHSIVQMPKGVPVATFAIGDAGAANAALFAVAMLARDDATLLAQLDAYRARQTEAARAMTATLK